MNYVAVINIGINNLKSIIGAVNYFGYKTIVTNKKEKIMNSSALILPGVGSYPAGMQKLKKTGLDIIIKKYFKQEKPILAVCLGFQMLFKSSDEFKYTKGLGFLSGRVKSLKTLKTKKMIPNLGWSKINFKKKKNNSLFTGVNSNSSLYFIHSYFVETTNKEYITSTIDFEKKKLFLQFSIKTYMEFNSIQKKAVIMGLKLSRIF